MTCGCGKISDAKFYHLTIIQHFYTKINKSRYICISHNTVKRMDEKKVHMGEIVKKAAKEKGLSAHDLSLLIFCTRQNVFDIYKREKIRPKLAELIDKKLGTNLMSYYQTEANEKNNGVQIYITVEVAPDIEIAGGISCKTKVVHIKPI